MNLISGKEALIALANGQIVEMKDDQLDTGWLEICTKRDDLIGKIEPCIAHFMGDFDQIEFRLKPRTITLNGIEVPAPFEPKEGDEYFFIAANCKHGYDKTIFDESEMDKWLMIFGAWRTEDEIKQVVDALRKVFKEPQQ